MKELTIVENLCKGDIVTMVEVKPVWNSEIGSCEDVTFTHKFEVVRNNPKTYGCKYIEGAHKNSGFNWVKGYDLTQNTKKKYFIED